MRKPCVLLLLFCFLACDKFTALDFILPDTYESVYCYVPDIDRPWKKDTTICFSKEELQLLHVLSGNGARYNLGLVTLDGQFLHWGCDTISCFLFEKSVVESYPWDYIVKHYCVLQRYDLSKDDIKRLNYQIPYPPSKEMADMHMYPRYCRQ